MSSRQELFRRLRPLLAEALGADEDEISMDTHVYDDLNADVIEFHDEVIPMLEEEFGVTIDDDEVSDLTTVRELVAYLAENI
ncbi:MAG TPA: acyl carrier protein [Chloroflexia bacterium]|jgi:acyl carrier protein